MRKLLVVIILLFFALKSMGQSDTIKMRKTKIGISFSLFMSEGNRGWGRIAFNPNIAIANRKHSVFVGPVFSEKVRNVGYLGWWSVTTDYVLVFNGFSFQYHFIPSYNKRWSPVAGFNFNYFAFADKATYPNGTLRHDANLEHYESLLTIGIQFNFLKNMSIVPQIALGHLYYKDKYYNPFYSVQHQEQKGNELSKSIRLSVNYFFRTLWLF